MEKKSLNLKVVNGGNKKYYLNLKETQKNAKYVSITQAELDKEGKPAYKSFIFFEEQFTEFLESFEALIRAKENAEMKSKLLKIGSKKLYLNLKTSPKGNIYLSMNSVSADAEGKPVYNTIYLFEGQFEQFLDAYCELTGLSVAV